MDPHDMSLAEQDEWLKKQAAWTEDEEKSAMEKVDTGPPLLVIWDLDGTLLDSESVVRLVVQGLVERRGFEYTQQVAQAGLGLRPFEATKALIESCGGLGGASVEEVKAEASAEMAGHWSRGVAWMPGAERALRYLASCGVTQALATSAPAASVKLKCAGHPLLGLETNPGKNGVFRAVVTGDDVSVGKPAPDAFLKAMQLCGVSDPRKCVVVEDSPAGVEGALRAGMKCVAVPSIALGFCGGARSWTEVKGSPSFKGCADILSCLYEWRPEKAQAEPHRRAHCEQS
mmetsp:Transcript_66557/g.150279  ORF Transcript_66557/g.150279 Transcript_66557/m.150279 type:complete len:287 (+) Transcript_66557:38-898(+)